MSITRDILFLFVAFLAGVAMASQGTMNSAVSKAIGLSESTFVVHLTATLVMTFILLLGLETETGAIMEQFLGITMQEVLLALLLLMV